MSGSFSTQFSTLLLAILFQLLPQAGQGQEKASGSGEVLTVKQRVDTLLCAAEEVSSFQPERAIEYAETAFDLSKKEKYQSGIVNAHYHLGVAYTYHGAFDPARKNLYVAIKLYTESTDEYGVILCHKYLGTLYRYSGNHDEALKHYIRASELAERVKWNNELLKLNNNIGTIYLDLKHYDKAIEYFQTCLFMEPDKDIEPIILGNLGLSYRNKGDLDEALRYFEKSRDKCREIGDINCEIGQLSYIATVYLDQKKYNEALEYFQTIIDEQERLGLRRSLLITYNKVGLTYRYQHQYDSAVVYFNKSLEIARETNDASRPYIHANLAMTYEDSKQFQLALDHLFEYQGLKDSLFTAEKNQHTEELLAKYEAEKNEKEIAILQKERELQKAEFDRQELIRNVAIGGASLMLIALIILIVNNQQKIKAQELLSLKNEELNRQKKKELIRDNEMKAIKAHIEGQEKERERIAQELHDGVAGNLAGIKLILANLSADNSKGSLQKAIKNIDDTYHDIRSLSHHLIPPKIKETAFIELIENYFDDLSTSHSFLIHLQCHPKMKLNELPDEIKVEIYRILQELMNNIIKHAHAGQVDIQLTLRDGALNLMVEDDGTGFDFSKASKGIGLNNIHSRVKLLQGDINIDSSLNRGTIVDINIPIFEEKDEV